MLITQVRVFFTVFFFGKVGLLIGCRLFWM
jgi:hypothetical protein